jgi:chromosome segregation ATPase
VSRGSNQYGALSLSEGLAVAELEQCDKTVSKLRFALAEWQEQLAVVNVLTVSATRQLSALKEGDVVDLPRYKKIAQEQGEAKRVVKDIKQKVRETQATLQAETDRRGLIVRNIARLRKAVAQFGQVLPFGPRKG